VSLDLNKDIAYLRACLKEMSIRLQYPGSLSATEIVSQGRVGETLLLVLDRLDALEGKTTPISDTQPEFQDRSFIVEYAGETLCIPEHRQQAEAAGYDIAGTYQIEPGKNYLKLRRHV
jgi:hypothetical protein